MDLKYDEFIEKIKSFMERNYGIFFVHPGGYSIYGTIQKSNINDIFIVGRVHWIGDGDYAMSAIQLCKNIEEAWKQIWDFNHFEQHFGPCEKYNYVFESLSYF